MGTFAGEILLSFFLLFVLCFFDVVIDDFDKVWLTVETIRGSY